MRSIIVGLSLACALLVLAGLVRSDNAVLDTVSFFRPVFVIGAALGLFAAKGWMRWGLLALVWAGFTSVWTSFPNAQPGGDLRLYSKNIRYDNAAIGPVRDDILNSGAEVVALQELSSVNMAILDELRLDFPHQAICGADTAFAMAVLSKKPFSEGPRCSQSRGLAAARVLLEGGPVWVVSVHWPWPWPAGSATSDAHMRGLIAGLTGPVVLAGDFNTLPWTHRLAGAMARSDSRQAGPTLLTLWHRRLWVPLPLDYVLAPAGGTVEARPLFGSDHMGLLADVSVFKKGG